MTAPIGTGPVSRQEALFGRWPWMTVRFLLPVLLLLLPAASRGQEGLSTLRGTVTDPSGGVMPGVEVTVEEVATGITLRKVITDNQGNYEVPALKEGTYRLTAARTGFKTLVENDIFIASDQVKRVDVQLEVGTTSTRVEVSGAANVIQTESGKIGSDFSGEQYQLAPMPANSYSSPLPVLATMPQIVTDAGNEFGVYMAGQGGANLDMGMDGVKEENLNTQTVNMEDVEEVKVEAVNNSAEFARIGYYNTITKRGTNQYHGEASYYHRNSALGARGFFENQKPLKLYHTFNLSGSGPIIRDRTFFYGLWNAERVPEHTFFLDNVPTDQMRNGDFSSFATIVDPLTGQPFSENMILPPRLNTVSLAVQDQYYHRANMGTPDSFVKNFGWVFPYPEDQYHADVLVTRIDHKISEKNSIYGRYSGYWPRYVLNNGDLPDLNWTRLRQSHSWAVVDTHFFSPNLVNTFTFGGNRDRIVDGTKVNGYQPLTGDKVVAALGLQGVNPKGYSAMGFPSMYFDSVTSLVQQPGGSRDASELQENWTFADSVNWAKGRHVVKFGGELRAYMDFNAYIPEGSYGIFNFDGRFTGNDYADFLLGLPATSTRLDPFTDRTLWSRESGLFVTDAFKVNRRLTLDLGMRWDYFTSPRYDDGLDYNWDPSTGDVVVPQAALNKISPLYPSSITVTAGHPVPHPSKRNLVPRLGAAYRITDKTVVRGAYGIFTEAPPNTPLFSFVHTAGGPFGLAETYVNSIQNGQPLFAFPDPFPANLGLAQIPSQSVEGFPFQTRNGRIHQFNLTVERQVRDIGFRLSYVGSRSTGLNYSLEINKPQPSLIQFTDSRRPWPQFQSVSYWRQNGAAHYDSLTLDAQRKVGQVKLDWFWTWANNLDTLELIDPYGDSLRENPYAPPPWNHDFVTPRHRVVFNTAWDVPVGRGRPHLANLPGALDKVIGGWTLYSVAFFQTGQWFTPTFDQSDPSNTNTFGGLPDRVANGNLPPSRRSVSHWFDASAFEVPPANTGRFGNSGVNILEGPGLNTINLTIRKRFRLTERWHFDLMAMCGNLFNHPNFYKPSADIEVPDEVGTIGGQHDRFFSGEKSGARVIELRGRLEF